MLLRRKARYILVHALACDNSDADLIEPISSNLISN